MKSVRRNADARTAISIEELAARGRSLKRCIRALIVASISCFVWVLWELIRQATGFVEPFSGILAPVCVALLGAAACGATVTYARYRAGWSDLTNIKSAGGAVGQFQPDLGEMLEIAVGGALQGFDVNAVIPSLRERLDRAAEAEPVSIEDSRRQLVHELVLPGGGKELASYTMSDWMRPQLGRLRSATASSAISALAVLGNASSVAVLERAAEQTRNSELRLAARTAAEAIRARLRYGPEQLLRAGSEAPESHSLVRPVIDDRGREQLLRPTDQE